MDPNGSFLGPNLALYSVYIFFVLSGASLFIAYSYRLRNEQELLTYFTNRLFRIVPLYVLVLCFYLVYAASTHDVGMGYLAEMFLNGTLLFGLGNPGGSLLVVGGWSLGIEFAFYLMFPILAALSNSRVWWVVLLILFVAQRLFVELLFRTYDLSGVGWVLYTQPLSFIGYFFAGCCIGRLVVQRTSPTHMISGLMVLFAAVCVIVFYQPATETASLKGVAGVVLSVVSCIAVYAASFIGSSGAWSKVSTFFGDSSYGVYLMHAPIMLLLLPIKESYGSPPSLAVTGFIIVTVGLALLSNRFFEMPMRRLGRKVAATGFQIGLNPSVEPAQRAAFADHRPRTA